MLAIRAAGFGLDAYARRGHLYSPKGEGQELQSEQRQLLPIVASYLVAILIGLALPSVGVALYFAVAVYLVWPFRGLHSPRSRVRGPHQ